MPAWHCSTSSCSRPYRTTLHPSHALQVWIRQNETKEETVLFQELPHALRNEVAWQACKSVFRQAGGACMQPSAGLGTRRMLLLPCRAGVQP